MEIGKLYIIKEDVTVYPYVKTEIYFFVLKRNSIVLCLKQLGLDYTYNFLYLFENKFFFLSYTALEKNIIEIFLKELK